MQRDCCNEKCSEAGALYIFCLDTKEGPFTLLLYTAVAIVNARRVLRECFPGKLRLQARSWASHSLAQNAHRTGVTKNDANMVREGIAVARKDLEALSPRWVVAGVDVVRAAWHLWNALR